ncbi:hypothetical protein A4A49_25323 [Nicotiana attenuata]|uniref:Uncharacterized protein n=1 Tax=Nicotiana attenuata TaxID=49451 RepID=A0A314KM15_NICAT|nr:hypothetical protein A4A49_25323 [Nicotiana attenuata]
MSGPSVSLFSYSPSVFTPNSSSSRVENTTENVELEGDKGNNIDASSVDETPYQSLSKTNFEPVIAGVTVNDKGKAKVMEDSELGGRRHESVTETETQPIDVDYSDDSQVKKKKVGVAPKKNITTTDVEKQLFDVRGIHLKIEVDCTDNQPNSFYVFGTQLPKTKGIHQSTGGDFKPTGAEDNDPYFGEMHNDYDQFERGVSGNDPAVIGDSTPKAPSMSDFCGVDREGGASGVSVKNATARHGVVNDDLRSAPCRHEGDLDLDSDFEYTDSQLDLIAAITQGGRRNVNQCVNELTTRDVNKSKPDQVVSRTVVQTQTGVETSHAGFT